MTNPRRPDGPREFGRDGISVIVDADRALRVREVGRQTVERRARGTLLERVEGRIPPAADQQK